MQDSPSNKSRAGFTECRVTFPSISFLGATPTFINDGVTLTLVFEDLSFFVLLAVDTFDIFKVFFGWLTGEFRCTTELVESFLAAFVEGLGAFEVSCLPACRWPASIDDRVLGSFAFGAEAST